MNVELRGEQIELLSQRAFHWPAAKILGLSDVHLGKAAALQSQGVPIPSGRTGDLDRIATLIQKYKPEEVYILGDWIHHKNGWTDDLGQELQVFFEDFSFVDWKLIIGNHEKGSLEILRRFPLQLIEEEVPKGPFVFSHGHQKRTGDSFSIEGHVHPVVVLREGSIKLRLPCFVVNDHSMVLPSFGELTGGYEVAREADSRFYAVTGESVFEVPPEKPKRRFRRSIQKS